MKNRKIKWLFSMTLILLVSLLAACAGSTDYKVSQNVVEASTLKDLMTQDNVIVIDARAQDMYVKGHLKGAVNLTPDVFNGQGKISAMLGSQQQFERIMSQNGITSDKTVIIYDNNGGVSAGRVWWAMKSFGHPDARVVNGGEAAILKANLEISAESPVLVTESYTANAVDPSLTASLEDVKDAMENATATLIDVRTKAEFDEGAIPTAILYPHTQNLYKDGTFKSSRDIYLNYKDLGLDIQSPIILYCKSSYRATQTLLLLKEAGFEDIRIYDGAWLEWSTSGMPTTATTGPVEATAQDAS